MGHDGSIGEDGSVTWAAHVFVNTKIGDSDKKDKNRLSEGLSPLFKVKLNVEMNKVFLNKDIFL